MQVSELSSNQYYGGLNKRYDKRVARIVSLGYSMRNIPIQPETWTNRTINVRIWVKVRAGMFFTIDNGVLFHASNRAFNELVIK